MKSSFTSSKHVQYSNLHLYSLKPITLFIMKFSLAAVALLGAVVSALPANEKRQAYIPCSGLYGTSQCCATDVLGVADLDCGNRKSSSLSIRDQANMNSPFVSHRRRQLQRCLRRDWPASSLLCPPHREFAFGIDD